MLIIVDGELDLLLRIVVSCRQDLENPARKLEGGLKPTII